MYARNISTALFHPARLRTTVLEMAYAGSTGHIACAFSIIEILAVLYRSFLRYPGNDPFAQARDFMVLSKGHGVMAQYACMRELGWIGESEVAGYFGNGSKLKGLSDSRVPGLEVTSGSLGHGLSIGAGMAFGAKLKGTGQKTYAIVGDGELNEGTIWEACMFSAHQQLQNLCVIVDENGFQAMGSTEEIIRLGSIRQKFEQFGFDSLDVDGHDENEIREGLTDLMSRQNGKPKSLIAKTVKGKGVPFMERDNIWHYTRLTSEKYAEAMAALGDRLT